MERSLGVRVPPRVPILFRDVRAYIAQSVEHILGKDEVSGSSPDVGSSFCQLSVLQGTKKNLSGGKNG